MKIKELVSILVPVYNIGEVLATNIEQIKKRVSGFLENVEIIISDDGSSDGSRDAIKDICNLHSNVFAVYSDENMGKGHALKRACEVASGAYIVFCDADLELDPAQLKVFFETMNNTNADVVIGSKIHKDSIVNYSKIRRVISFVYFLFIKIFFRLPINDTQTGLKLFKRAAIVNVFPRILVRAFAYDLEVLAAINQNGYKIVSAPIILSANRHFGFIKLSILYRTFIDTLAIFYRMHFLGFYKTLFKERIESPLVSIIIPLKKMNDYILEATTNVLKQTYSNFELIILPDEYLKSQEENKIFLDSRVRIKGTGAIPPALKRHEGVLISRGSILAFLDDDTYPEINWLENAIRAMEHCNVSALGGPAVSTKKDSFLQQVSGAIYASTLMAGKHVARYTPRKVQYINDYPSCNFFIKKSLYNDVGGFNSDFWPGEDTILCNNIIKANHKILYTPEALVYHHRRTLFFGHFKQLSGYAWHRGLFVRYIGGNSLSVSYFMPSIFLLYILYLPIAFAFDLPAFINMFLPSLSQRFITYTLLAPHVLYTLCLIGSMISTLSPIMGLFKAIGIFVSHCVYGAFFIKGIFSSKK